MTAERPKSRRKLSADESALWRMVARSIKPLRPMTLDAEPAATPPAAPVPAKPKPAKPAARLAKPQPKASPPVPQPQGSAEIDAAAEPVAGRAEGYALWRMVVRSIKPLRPTILESEPAAAAPVPAIPPKPRPRPAKPAAAPPQPKPSPSAPPSLAPLVRREKQRLARGTADIDARIDLHGMTQAQAHAALARFLHRAQADGAKFALVITGKGGRFAEHGGHGVLRRQVPLWLRLSEFRDLVVGFESAHAAHGGDGAFYVRVRRGRN